MSGELRWLRRARGVGLGAALVALAVALFVRRTVAATAEGELPQRNDLLQMLDDAREGAQRIAKIVSDVATLSRADEDWIQPVDLLPTLEAAIGVAANELRHHAQLERHFEAVPPILGSRSRLTQVFLNLLINAAQAIPPGAAARQRVTVSVTREGAQVVVAISDTGVGMTAEVMAHVFDPFFTTKGVGEGTGLGLAICHGIVTRIGGEISVESEVGKGSTFRVFLPVAPLPAVTPRLAPPALPELPALRILIIDDEPLVCHALARVLDGHLVRTTTSAEEALAMLAAGEPFDAILCDLMMPDTGGVEFAAEIQERLPETAGRIIYMTGGALTADTSSFLEKCVNPPLTKPIDAAALFAALARVCGVG